VLLIDAAAAAAAASASFGVASFAIEKRWIQSPSIVPAVSNEWLV
jgi:hypothetical protein